MTPPAVVEAVKEAKETVAAKVAAKKAPAQKKVEDIYLQFGGSEWNISDCKERALAAYTAAGHKAAGGDNSPHSAIPPTLVKE